MDEIRDEQVDPNASVMAENLTDDGTPMDVPHEPPVLPESSTATEGSSSVTETVGNVARSLKPVAEVAENIAGHAVSLSAQGINWLDSTLADRRKHREENGLMAETTALPSENSEGNDSIA
jgi:hypothetical protein